MMFDRRLLENFDWVLLCLVLALCALGVVNLVSASVGLTAKGTPLFLKQIYWILIGLGVMVFLLFFDYHYLRNPAYVIYGLSVLLLALVQIVGRKSLGAQRWVDLGFVSFQPSELIKVAVVVALASYFSRREYPDGLGFKELAGPGLLVGLPFVLILRQPDLGTALHLAFACLSVLLFLKVRGRVLVVLALGLALSLPVAWNKLETYQRARIETFLNPYQDPLGKGYHIIQSNIAVGSGQFWGKGWMKGTQSQLAFLPEQHTDFAFSVFAEEWGFMGSVVVVALFFFLVLAGLQIARRSQDRFGALLALGLVAVIFWQVIINLSMVTGMMPVVGLPLPFISYGGTSLLTMMICVGLLLNISMRRFLFQET
ncbi:MAG: rod shape-determining protein RodA [Thermodesulfobacteriota bacterium]